MQESSTAQYNTAQYSTAQCCAAQCCTGSTLPCCAVARVALPHAAASSASVASVCRLLTSLDHSSLLRISTSSCSSSANYDAQCIPLSSQWAVRYAQNRLMVAAQHNQNHVVAHISPLLQNWSDAVLGFLLSWSSSPALQHSELHYCTHSTVLNSSTVQYPLFSAPPSSSYSTAL